MAFITMLIASLWNSIYVLTIYLSSRRACTLPKSKEQCALRSISVVVPCRNEPEKLVAKWLRMEIPSIDYEVVIVIDDPVKRVRKMIEDVGLSERTIVICRINGVGGRSGALTDGARFASKRNIMVLDVDAEADVQVFYEAAECCDVCVFRWDPYTSVNTRVEEAMAFITGFGSWLFYEMRSKRFFVYPLGSGTVIRRDILKDVGYWDRDIIQDDIWLGVKLMRRGIMPKLASRSIGVGVPFDMRGVKIQQCRWGYGAIDVAIRGFKDILRAPIPLTLRIEALSYILQPLQGLLALLAIVFLVLAVVMQSGYEPLNIALIAIVILLSALTPSGVIMSIYGRIRGLDLWRRMVLAGRSAAIMSAVAPLVGVYVLAALLRLRISYKITPKEGIGGGILDPITLAIVCILGIVLVVSIMKMLTLVAMLSMMMLVPHIYCFIRART